VGGNEPKSELRGGGGGERTNRGIQHAHRSEAINRRGLLCPSPPPLSLSLLVLARRQHQKLSSKAGVVHPFGRRVSFGLDLLHASHRIVSSLFFFKPRALKRRIEVDDAFLKRVKCKK